LYEKRRFCVEVKVLLNVRSVTVSGPADLIRGMDAAYTAALDVIPDLDEYKNVPWSIDETGGHEETTIDSDGKLTAAAGETLSQITVRASSVSDPSVSGTLTVRLRGWTAVSDTTFADSSIRGIVFGNGGNFVAIDYEGKTASSTDGVNWTAGGDAELSPIPIPDSPFRYTLIAFGNVGNGRFVAVGDDGKAFTYSFSE
jgi:hypothetical protein